MMKAQCHCRECQYITGGAPNMFMPMPPAGFRYTKGQPKQHGGPQMAIYTVDRQPFHQIPDGLPAFERLPQR